MGLSNGATRARNYGQTINQPQGGGSKKAGFPYQIGRTTWSSIFIDNQSRSTLIMTKNPNVRISRPMGSTINVPYWNNGAHY
jgi:hypothetical protein